MINDLVKLFESAYMQQGDKIILNSYQPKRGLYIRINKDGTRDRLVIGKETSIEDKNLYDWFRQRDYYSILIDMNKSVDPAKKIHSNNFMTMFMKKGIFPGVGEDAMPIEAFKERLNVYFDILEQPEKKYNDSNSKELLKSIEAKLDKEALIKNRNYLLENIKSLIEDIKQEQFEGYVSIFFEAELDIYEQECKRYMTPKIFNKNAFNVRIGNNIMGLSNYNMGSNDKKPYLELKTMNCKVPYRVTTQDAILTKKFFDWLSFQPNNEIYISYDFKFDGVTLDPKNINSETACYFLYITKGKEILIEDFEFLPSYSQRINFKLRNILQIEDANGNIQKDETLNERKTLENKVNSLFFNGRLLNGYYYEPKIKSGEFSKQLHNLFMISKEGFYRFFKKGVDEDLKNIIDRISMQIVLEHFNSSDGLYSLNTAWAYNLRMAFLDYYSIGGGAEMADKIQKLIERLKEKSISKEYIICDDDEEFSFAAGQLTKFILSKSEAKNKNHRMVEPFLRAKSGIEIKKQLRNIFDKYKHAINFYDNKFDNIFSMVLGYDMSARIHEDLYLAGFMTKNIMFLSSKINKSNSNDIDEGEQKNEKR